MTNTYGKPEARRQQHVYSVELASGIFGCYEAYRLAIRHRRIDAVKRASTGPHLKSLEELERLPEFPVLFMLWCKQYPAGNVRVERMSMAEDPRTAILQLRDADGSRVCVEMRMQNDHWKIAAERFY